LVFFVGLLVLAGCTRQYLLKTSNGAQIISSTKPRLQGTQYYFKDQDGVDHVIPKSRVVKIKAVTVVDEAPGSPAQKAPSPPTPKKSKH
jgi:hypothetical protein